MLKNLKSLFIVDEELTEETKPAIKDKPSDKIVPKTAASPTPPPYTGGALDQKILESLLKAFESANLDGFDYIEYKNSIKALNSLPIDEAIKFQSAFATASTMGVTKEKLIQSVEYYKGILEKEKQKFNETLRGQIELNVTTKEKDIDQLTKEIAKKAEQIKKLTEEISLDQDLLSKTKGAIAEVTNKIDITKNNFNTSFDYIMAQINDDVNKMNTYLK